MADKRRRGRKEDVRPVVRAVASALSFVLVGILSAWSPAVAEEQRFQRTRIPHLDGTGRVTIVEVDPEIPGAAEFLRAGLPCVPQPGELIVPAQCPDAIPAPEPARRE